MASGETEARPTRATPALEGQGKRVTGVTLVTRIVSVCATVCGGIC
jgi:hypothetical protein